MLCSYTSFGLIRLNLIIPVRISWGAILTYKGQDHQEVGNLSMRFEGDLRWIQFCGQDSVSNETFWTPQCIFTPSRVRVCVCEYMQHPVFAYPLGAPAFHERRLALWNHQGTDCVSLCSYSSSCSALKSNTRLLSCYLVIFIVFSLRNAMQHPEG